MWSTQTVWFDVAVVMSIFAIGNICFGRFEEHRSRLRRLAKVALVLGVAIVFSAYDLRIVTYVILGVLLVLATLVHVWWLPKHGVNGWTCEPRRTYYDLLKVPVDQRPGNAT